jgi:hypothetical protein
MERDDHKIQASENTFREIEVSLLIHNIHLCPKIQANPQDLTGEMTPCLKVQRRRPSRHAWGMIRNAQHQKPFSLCHLDVFQNRAVPMAAGNSVHMEVGNNLHRYAS